MSAPRAIVVGGSVGGLMAAHALRSGGAEVVVLERSPAPLAGFGQGIRVQPAVLDLLDQVAAEHPPLHCEELDERRYLDASGAVVHRIAEAGRTTHWNTLYETLRDRGGLDYRLASRVVDVRQDDRHAVVAIDGGGELAADLVVFADGLGSLGRGIVSPGAAARYAGYVAWRGTAPPTVLDDAQRDSLDRGLNIQLMPGSHIHVYPVPGTAEAPQLLNFVWYRNVDEAELPRLLTDADGRTRRNSVPTGAVTPAIVAELRAVARDVLSPPFAAVVAAATPSVQTIVDVESTAMARGRIAVLGDAAFVARPHLGAGTAKAAEDAMGLAAALDATTDVPTALARWQTERLPASAAIVRMSRELGERYQVHGTYPGDPEVERLARAASRLVRDSRSERTP